MPTGLTARMAPFNGFDGYDATDDVGGVVIFSEDITERRQMEEEVRQSEDRFRTMANAIPQLAWIAEADGYIFWYNQRWYDYTGTTPAQMQGWGWQSVHNSETLPGVLERWKNSIATDKPFDMVFPLRGADGSFRDFLTRVMPVKNENGDVVQWCGTNTDITEQKMMENEVRKSRDELELRVQERTTELKKNAEELRLLNQQLQASNRELEEFAFVTSHDLQEPLRKIQAFGDRLRLESAGSLNEKSLDFLGRMEKSASRMQILIRTILDYSRIAICHRPFSPVGLNSILVEVQSNVLEQLTRVGGKIAVDSLPTIEADRVQLEQLFENLISNALKYHRPNVPPLVRIHTNGAGEDGICSISVEDNGIGFDERFVNKIFAPFQRLHARKEYEGTGIGLAICRRIVERHNGSIVAKSSPGHGSTFILTLPLRHEGAEYRDSTEGCEEIFNTWDMKKIEEEKS